MIESIHDRGAEKKMDVGLSTGLILNHKNNRACDGLNEDGVSTLVSFGSAVFADIEGLGYGRMVRDYGKVEGISKVRPEAIPFMVQLYKNDTANHKRVQMNSETDSILSFVPPFHEGPIIPPTGFDIHDQCTAPAYIIDHVSDWICRLIKVCGDTKKLMQDGLVHRQPEKAKLNLKQVLVKRHHNKDLFAGLDNTMFCSEAFCKAARNVLPGGVFSIERGYEVLEGIYGYIFVPMCILKFPGGYIDVTPGGSKPSCVEHTVFIPLDTASLGVPFEAFRSLFVFKSTAVCVQCGKRGKVKCKGGCDLVRYCSNKCLVEHKPRHLSVCTPLRAYVTGKDKSEGFVIAVSKEFYR